MYCSTYYHAIRIILYECFFSVEVGIKKRILSFPNKSKSGAEE